MRPVHNKSPFLREGETHRICSCCHLDDLARIFFKTLSIFRYRSNSRETTGSRFITFRDVHISDKEPSFDLTESLTVDHLA